MQIKMLQYMVDIAQTHSISQSARNMFVSQQVMSRAIKNLEEELAVTLLERSKTGVELTSAGRVFLEKAQTMLTLWDDLDQELESYRESAPKAAGNLLIYTMPKLGGIFAENLLSDFSLGVSVEKITLKTLDSMEIIQSCGYDPSTIGVITIRPERLAAQEFQEALQERRLRAEVLATYPLIVCMHKNSIWAKEASFTLSELSKIPMAVAEPNALVTTGAQETANIAYAVESLEMQKKFVDKKLGVTLLTPLEYDFLFGHANKYVLRPLQGSISLSFAFIISAECTPSEALQRFIKKLRKVIC